MQNKQKSIETELSEYQTSNDKIDIDVTSTNNETKETEGNTTNSDESIVVE